MQYIIHLLIFMFVLQTFAFQTFLVYLCHTYPNMTEKNQIIFYKHLSKQIRNIRLSQGFTQEELADRVGISRSSLVNIEKNRQRPSIHLLFELSQISSSSIDMFFEGLPKTNTERDIPKEIENKIKKELDDESSDILRNVISKIPPKH